MNRISTVVAVLCLAAVAACDGGEEPALLEPDSGAPAIIDSRDNGSGVFLLPPIDAVNTIVRTAPFELNADPRIEVCRLDVQGALTEANIEAAECLDPLVAWYETDASSDGTTFIQVTPAPGAPATADSSYSVGWNTDPAWANEAFRVSVLLPDLSFDLSTGTLSVDYVTAAYFDAMLYDNASTKLDGTRVVGYNAGQNFPIKLIIEEGSLCDGVDCFAYEVTCLGGVFRTDHAGVSMPLDWAAECTVEDPGEEERWFLYQEQLPPGSECVPLPSDGIDGIAFEPCYIWQLVQEIDTGDGTEFVFYTEEFAEWVTVQMCGPGDASDALFDLMGMFRYSSLPGGGFETSLNPESGVAVFDDPVCPYPGTSSQGLGLSALYTGAVHPALRLLGLAPGTLYAGDGGTLSTNTRRMSHFQWILQLVMTPTDATVAGLVGGSVELEVAVASPPHDGGAGDPEPVSGVTVEFRSSSDDAVLGQAITDVDGLASLTIALPGTPGTFGVYAVVIYEDQEIGLAEWTVEAVDLFPAFLEPLQTGDFASTDETFAPTVYICRESRRPCTAANAEAVYAGAAVKLVEQNGRKFYQTNSWKPRDTGTASGTTVYVQVLVNGTTIGYSIPVVVTKGGKGELVEDVYYNGENSTLTVKFSIERVEPAS